MALPEIAGHNEYKKIPGVTAKCLTDGCRWNAIGIINVEVATFEIGESSLVRKCRNHHKKTNDRTGHNQFLLFKNGKELGFASVSSGIACGEYEFE